MVGQWYEGETIMEECIADVLIVFDTERGAIVGAAWFEQALAGCGLFVCAFDGFGTKVKTHVTFPLDCP